MARTLRTVITNFSSGELNPLLATRTDVGSYFQGAKSCKNFSLLAEGGLMRSSQSINLNWIRLKQCMKEIEKKHF